MNMEKHNNMLDQIPADYALIEELYSHGKITWEARDYALRLLYPHNHWGMWISRLLLIFGVVLLLSGVVYFFAFNWIKITPMMKLYFIQTSIVFCLIGAYIRSLDYVSGQTLLLSGSILVGLFLLVFGQIYRTGADAYQFFMMWSLFTFGWTLISNFAAQWFFWLIITNAFLIFLWVDVIIPTAEMTDLIFTYLVVFNGIALVLRENLLMKNGCKWLEAKWIRIVLTMIVLLIAFIPMAFLIVDASEAVKSTVISGVVGLIVHGVMYYIYRYKLPDITVLFSVVFSGFAIFEIFVLQVLTGEMFQNIGAAIYLIMGFITLGMSTLITTYLRNVSKKLEGADV